MDAVIRSWTAEEEQKLFELYFGPLPGTCPVCGDEVLMTLSSLREPVTLLLKCQGCGNRARVSRVLSESALAQTACSQVARPRSEIV